MVKEYNRKSKTKIEIKKNFFGVIIIILLLHDYNLGTDGYGERIKNIFLFTREYYGMVEDSEGLK